MIENSSKTPLNISPLQCTYLGKKSFQYHQGLVRKKEIEKWLLRTSVQCILAKVDVQVGALLRGPFKETRSATVNIFRFFFLFSFQIICKSGIKLCFYNKSVHYS